MSRRPSRPSHEDILWLDDYLPYRLAVVATWMLRDAASVYKNRADALTTPQWRTLAILAINEPLTATDLARISMLDKVAISRALAQLEERGFVNRAPTRSDRRARRINLTAEGWRYYNELVPEIKRREEMLRTALGAADLKRLFAILDRFTQIQKSVRCA